MEVFTDHYINSVNAAFLKMRHYYTLIDKTCLYRIAVTIQRECRSSCFTNNWLHLEDSEIKVNNAKSAINNCWKDYLTSREAQQAAATSNHTSTSLPTPLTTSAGFTAKTTTATPTTVYTATWYKLIGIRQKSVMKGQ